MKKILVVEDEAQVISFIKKGLTEEGFEVTAAMDGKTGLELFRNHTFDLIILDIMMPGMNGLEVCSEIRKENKVVPILFLTALGTPENVALGLGMGADDYLVKPFKFIELLARVKSLLRRMEITEHLQPVSEVSELIEVADLVINDKTKQVFRDGKEISLTATEYRLLHFFVENKNRVLSRIELLDAVWGVNFDMGTNVVDVYVNYLRNKVDKGYEQKLLHTVVGMGYVLKEA
jgi:two-component system, OmpR family, copper resistance phosphate regulon response regulator CusR